MMTKYLLIAFFHMAALTMLLGQKYYIIQVAYLADDFEENNFEQLKAWGQIIAEPFTDGGSKVYLVGKKYEFLTRSEAESYHRRIKRSTPFRDAFIVDLKDIVPLKNFSTLESNKDRLTLTIYLKGNTSSPTNDNIPTEMEKSPGSSSSRPGEHYGFYSLQLSANQTGSLTRDEGVRLLRKFNLPPSDFSKINRILVLQGADKKRVVYKYLYDNFDQDENRAEIALARIKSQTACERTNECPLLLYIDKDLSNTNTRNRNLTLPSVRKIGDHILKYYVVQIGASPEQNYGNDMDGLKSNFAQKYPHFVKGSQDLTIFKMGNVYKVCYKKFLAYHEAKKVADRFAKYYSKSGAFVIEVDAP